MTENVATRLGRLIRERRKSLNLTQADIQAAGGPSTATLRLIEGGKHTDFRSSTSQPLEKVLQWAPGSIDQILGGGEATPLPDGPDDRPLKDIDVTARGADGLRNHMRRSTIMAKGEADRTNEERAFVAAFDEAHPRRPDPALGVDEDGNWLPVETTFENWLRARNQLSARVLHYARARGISFKAAEEELPHVQQMAADVANETGRPWTPPWDPGEEFDEDEEPWKAEFWSYTEAVPSPYGGEGYIYQVGTTYDLAEARSNREKSTHAARVWEEDKAKQAAAYYERLNAGAESGDPEFEAWITRSQSRPPAEPSRLSRLIRWPEGAGATLDDQAPPPNAADTERGLPTELTPAAERLLSPGEQATQPDRGEADLTSNEAPPYWDDLAEAARTAPAGYRSPGQAARDAQDEAGEEGQDLG